MLEKGLKTWVDVGWRGTVPSPVPNGRHPCNRPAAVPSAPGHLHLCRVSPCQCERWAMQPLCSTASAHKSMDSTVDAYSAALHGVVDPDVLLSREGIGAQDICSWCCVSDSHRLVNGWLLPRQSVNDPSDPSCRRYSMLFKRPLLTKKFFEEYCALIFHQPSKSNSIYD